MARNRQVAFLFNEGGEFTSERIGGKAMSLVTMTRLGMPVPPGFAVSTGVCRAYLEHARYPRRLEWHVKRCIAALERETGRRFGDSSNPLLVSVRSGAPVSMPGMMDTILNLGITNGVSLAKNAGRKFAQDTAERFLSGFRKVTGSEPSMENPWEQLELAFEAICQSWLNNRAAEYRKAHQIPDDLGTAMVVQAMVFGNLDDKSGTGVLFSRNVATGERELYGEFLPQAQGEDVVSGAVTPLPIMKLAELHPQAFSELADFAKVLERRENDVVEIEFTIESGRLWILQYRVAKRTPVAAARFAVQAVWEKRLLKTDAVARVSDGEIERIRRPEFDPAALEAAAVLGRGIPASPGAVTGVAVFTPERAQELAKRGEQVVLVRPNTSPNDFLGMLVSAAVVTMAGGTTSHAAVVARGLGKPAVVGVEDLDLADIADGTQLSVDGTRGLVLLGRVPFAYGAQHKEVSIFLKWFTQSGCRLHGRADFSAVDREWSANRILNDFYITDAMASAAAGTKLEREAKVLRHRVHREAAEVFACYLITAVSGELRHGWTRSGWKSEEFKELNSRFGVNNFTVQADPRFEAQMSVVNRLRDSSHGEQEDFLRLAIPAFNTWDTTGSGVGGPRWAAIAEAVLAYLSGQIGDTVFVDRVFDLRHNGGRLFNKHPMFSQTDEGSLIHQLDAKRNEKTIDELVPRFCRIFGRCCPYHDDRISFEVVALWQKGDGKYWGKSTPRCSAAERSMR